MEFYHGKLQCPTLIAKSNGPWGQCDEIRTFKNDTSENGTKNPTNISQNIKIMLYTFIFDKPSFDMFLNIFDLPVSCRLIGQP